MNKDVSAFNNLGQIRVFSIILALLITMHGGQLPIEFSFFALLLFLHCFFNLKNPHLNKLGKEFGSRNKVAILFCIWAAFLIIDSIYRINFGDKYTDTYDIILRLSKYLACFTVYVFALLLLRNKSDLSVLLSCFVIIGTCISVYAILNIVLKGNITVNENLTPFSIDDWTTKTRGTLSYPAHLAALLNILIPFAIAFTYTSFRKKINKGKKIVWIITSITSFHLIGCLLMIIALLQTSSRGGNLAFLLAIMTSSLIIVVKNRSILFAKSRKFIKVLSITLIMILSIYFSAGSSILERFINDKVDPHGRQHSIQTAMTIIDDTSILGVGLGNYSGLAKKHKEFESGYANRSTEEHAMNDYIELYVEQGIIGISLLIICISISLKQTISKLNIENRMFPFLAASLCSMLAVLLHAMFDFLITLPVISVFLFLTMAIARRSYILYDIKR